MMFGRIVIHLCVYITLAQQVAKRISPAQSLAVECPTAPTQLSSCPSNVSATAIRATTVVVQNYGDKPLLVEWLDERGEAVPKYLLPADCSVWFPSILGQAYRARASVIPGGGRRLLPCRYPLSRPLRPAGIFLPQLAESVNTSTRGSGHAWTGLGGGSHVEQLWEMQILTHSQRAQLSSYAYARGQHALCGEILSGSHTGMPSPHSVAFDSADEVEVMLLPEGHPQCAPSSGYWLPPNRPPVLPWPPARFHIREYTYSPPVPVGPAPEASKEHHEQEEVGNGDDGGELSMEQGQAGREKEQEKRPPFELEVKLEDVHLGASSQHSHAGRRAGGTSDDPDDDGEGDEEAFERAAFADFLRSLDEDSGHLPGHMHRGANGVRIRRRERASFSLSVGKVVGVHPVDKHEGMVMYAQTSLQELSQPRMLSAAFQRPCPCPACNYKLPPTAANESSSRTEQRAGGGEGDPAQAGGGARHAHDEEHTCAFLGGHARIQLQQCSRCQGEGVVSVSSDAAPAGMSSEGYSHVLQQVKTHCPLCGGVGTVPKSDPLQPVCPLCASRRYVRQSHLHVSYIPAGVPDDWAHVTASEGGMLPFKTPGDIKAQLAVEPQPADPRKKEAIALEATAAATANVANAAITGLTSTTAPAGAMMNMNMRLSNYTRLSTLPGWATAHWAPTRHAQGTIRSSLLSLLSSVPIDTQSPSVVCTDGPHVGATVTLPLAAAVAGFKLRIRPPAAGIAAQASSTSSADGSLDGAEGEEELMGLREEELAWRRSLQEAAEQRARESAYASGLWGAGGQSGPGEILEMFDTDASEPSLVLEQDEGDKAEGEREPEESIDLDVSPGTAEASFASTASSSKTGIGRKSTKGRIPLRLIDESFVSGVQPWVIDMRGSPVLPGDVILMPGAGLPVYVPHAPQHNGTLHSQHCEWNIPCPSGDRHACGLPRHAFSANCTSLAGHWQGTFQGYLEACEHSNRTTGRTHGRGYAHDENGSLAVLPWSPLLSLSYSDLHVSFAALLQPVQAPAAPANGTNTNDTETVPPPALRPPARGSVHILCPAFRPGHEPSSSSQEGRDRVEHSLPGSTLMWPPLGSAVRHYPHGAAVLIPQVETGLGFNFAALYAAPPGASDSQQPTGQASSPAAQATQAPKYRPAPGDDLLPDKATLLALRSLVRSAVTLMAPAPEKRA